MTSLDKKQQTNKNHLGENLGMRKHKKVLITQWSIDFVSAGEIKVLAPGEIGGGRGAHLRFTELILEAFLSSWMKDPSAMLPGYCEGLDGWMASPTQWTWIWVNSESWWWTGRPGVLQSMGLQTVRHDWATELNWTELTLTTAPKVIPESTNWKRVKGASSCAFQTEHLQLSLTLVTLVARCYRWPGLLRTGCNASEIRDWIEFFQTRLGIVGMETPRGEATLGSANLYHPNNEYPVWRAFMIGQKERKSLSSVRLFATPWTVAYQALPSMGFSRQEY